MPSTYTPSLRLELQENGENDTSWGDKTNTNLGTVLETAIAGVATISMSNADYSLSVNFAAQDEARNAVIVATGSVSAPHNIIVPAVTKTYIVRNITSGGQSVFVKTQAGQAVEVTNGEVGIMYCDGTNMISAASQTKDGALAPSKISTAASSWAFNGAIGVNNAPAVDTTIGAMVVNGSTGSWVQYKVGGNALATTACTSTVWNFAAPSIPITWSTNNLVRVTVGVDGSVTIPGAVTTGAHTATSLTSNVDITAGRNISATGTLSGASVSGGAVTATGNVVGTNITATSTVTGTTVTATGAVNGNTVTATGAVSGGSVASTGAVTGTNITATGTVTGATVTSTGNVNAVNVTASNAMNAAAITSTGAVNASSAAITNGITCTTLTASGNITWNSDERLKHEWRTLPSSFVNEVALVKSGLYTRTDTGQQQAGVTAQSLRTVLPECVHQGEQYLSVEYANAAMVTAVELCKKVVALEARIAELESK